MCRPITTAGTGLLLVEVQCVARGDRLDGIIGKAIASDQADAAFLERSWSAFCKSETLPFLHPTPRAGRGAGRDCFVLHCGLNLRASFQDGKRKMPPSSSFPCLTVGLIMLAGVYRIGIATGRRRETGALH